eukprot:UN04023
MGKDRDHENFEQTWDAGVRAVFQQWRHYLNYNAEKPTPYPEGLNVFPKSEVFLFGSFDALNEYRDMNTVGRKTMVHMMNKCKKRSKEEEYQYQNRRKHYYVSMDNNLKRSKINASSLRSRGHDKGIKTSVKSVEAMVKEMSRMSKLREIPSLPEPDT